MKKSYLHFTKSLRPDNRPNDRKHDKFSEHGS